MTINWAIKTKFIALITFAAMLSASPMLSADEEAIARGEKLFNELAGLGCKGCHGEFGEGDLGVGPYIRGATEGAVRAAIDGIDTMIVIKSVIDEQGIKDVSEYVNSLGSTRIVRTLAKKGRFLPNTFTVAPNSKFQIVVQNASFQPRVFLSEDLGFGDGLEIDARTTSGVNWTSPADGEIKLWCKNCDLQDEFFTVQVDPNL